jgi:hypothetical protein
MRRIPFSYALADRQIQDAAESKLAFHQRGQQPVAALDDEIRAPAPVQSYPLISIKQQIVVITLYHLCHIILPDVLRIIDRPSDGAPALPAFGKSGEKAMLCP